MRLRSELHASACCAAKNKFGALPSLEPALDMPPERIPAMRQRGSCTRPTAPPLFSFLRASLPSLVLMEASAAAEVVETVAVAEVVRGIL